VSLSEAPFRVLDLNLLRVFDASGRDAGKHSVTLTAATGKASTWPYTLAQKVNAESQIFRIDHFLGKEPAQNILAFRFANGLFEPIWNRNFIDHVQIDVPEAIGLGKRAGFYEQTGAFRDMVVTHLFQILAFMAMEPPTALEPAPISEEKNKVFRSMLPIQPADVVRGQYAGYRAEPGVDRVRRAGRPDESRHARQAKQLLNRRQRRAVIEDGGRIIRIAADDQTFAGVSGNHNGWHANAKSVEQEGVSGIGIIGIVARRDRSGRRLMIVEATMFIVENDQERGLP